MNKTMQIRIPIFLLLGLLIFFSFPVLALEITYPKLPGGISLPEEPTLQEYVRYINAFSIVIAGLIAFGALVYGGFRYLISAGNPLAMADARDQIGAGFLGAIILLGSYLILTTISPHLVKFPEIKPGVEKVPEVTISPPQPGERKDLVFQIPLGKIIERAILADEAEETKKLIKEIPKTIEEISDLFNRINTKVFELKKLIDACNCGISQCTGDCLPQACQVNCDFDAIFAKSDEIKNAPELQKLKEKERKLAELRAKVEERLLDLYKAVFLTTIFYDDVRDYFSFAVEREILEQTLDSKIEIETLPEWEDINIFIKTPDGRTIADPATFYLWRTYEEMQIAIEFALQISGDYDFLPPGTSLPPGTICLPPGAEPGKLILPAVNATITQEYGPASCAIYPNCFHNGLDLTGDPILAAADGKVIDINTGCTSGCLTLREPECSCGGTYGNWILIEHQDPKIYTFYAHLDQISVNPGQNVRQGQVIGTQDATGYVLGTHLHFMVFIGLPAISGSSPNKTVSGSHTDPMYYITGEGPAICEGGGGRCEVITDPDNPCNAGSLLPYFGAKAQEASQICYAESRGNVWALNDKCKIGKWDYSVGLFQINLYGYDPATGWKMRRCEQVGINSDDIFEYISPSTCKVKNKSLAEECARRWGWGDADLNSQKATQIFQDWGNWCAWSTACPQVCNFCSDKAFCP